MEVMDLIRERRSIRSYDGRVVETEQLKKVLEAGRLAAHQNRVILFKQQKGASRPGRSLFCL